MSRFAYAFVGALILLCGPALADDLAIYKCHVFSFGRELFAREIKLQTDGQYDAWAVSTGEWGQPGTGEYILNDDGTPTFTSGPLESAAITEVSNEQPFAGHITVKAPGDDGGTICVLMWEAE